MNESLPQLSQARILSVARIIWAAVFLSLFGLTAVALIQSGAAVSRTPENLFSAQSLLGWAVSR